MTIDFKNPIHVYFIGIGGISMSGLAGILLSKGFKVTGSDTKASALTDELASKGAKIFIGQNASNLEGDYDLIVYTAAIRPGNPEYDAMMASSVPHMSRAEFLGALMKNYGTPIGISGTNGKTTTTTMISEILLKAEADPTISVGGIIKSINSNIRIGGPDYFVF